MRVVLAALVNDPTIADDLFVVLGQPWLRITHSISVRSSDQISFGHTNQYTTYMGPPNTELFLTFYIDQLASLTSKDVLQSLDEDMGKMLHHIDGIFTQRTVEPFKEQQCHWVSYKVKLRDFDNFVNKLHHYALSKVDEEFTVALETKLSED